MKRLLVILFIVFSVIIAGVLYATHGDVEKGPLSLELAYMTQYPAQMPNLIIEPATGCLMMSLSY